MSRGERPDLPLFDLPLHGELEESSAAEQEAEPAPAATAEQSGGSPRDPEQSRLFDESDEEVGTPEAADESVGATADPGDDDVGLLDRLVGGVIDLSVHLGVLATVVGASWALGAQPSWDDAPAFGVFLLLFSLLYTGVPLAFWGQTPGMMRVGHVARTGSGEPLTFGQTALRWLGALLTLALAGLPLLLALGSDRSLADRLSGSYTEPA